MKIVVAIVAVVNSTALVLRFDKGGVTEIVKAVVSSSAPGVVAASETAAVLSVVTVICFESDVLTVSGTIEIGISGVNVVVFSAEGSVPPAEGVSELSIITPAVELGLPVPLVSSEVLVLLVEVVPNSPILSSVVAPTVVASVADSEWVLEGVAESVCPIVVDWKDINEEEVLQGGVVDSVACKVLVDNFVMVEPSKVPVETVTTIVDVTSCGVEVDCFLSCSVCVVPASETASLEVVNFEDKRLSVVTDGELLSSPPAEPFEVSGAVVTVCGGSVVLSSASQPKVVNSGAVSGNAVVISGDTGAASAKKIFLLLPPKLFQPQQNIAVMFENTSDTACFKE